LQVVNFLVHSLSNFFASVKKNQAHMDPQAAIASAPVDAAPLAPSSAPLEVNASTASIESNTTNSHSIIVLNPASSQGDAADSASNTIKLDHRESST